MIDFTPRRFSALAQFLTTKLNSLSDTPIDQAEISQKLQNYGCHCFQEMNDLVRGQGPPVDELDNLCKKLFKCHQCVNKIDYPGEGCEFTSSYKYQQVPELFCEPVGTNTACQKEQCECDLKFAEELAELWVGDDWEFNNFYWKQRKNVKKNPTFDKEAVCYQSGSAEETDKCCGQPGSRVPYNSDLRECCTDGKLRGFGAC